jgi:lactate dehydrogenase-like 2-hydroxyacid dehydrogenase
LKKIVVVTDRISVFDIEKTILGDDFDVVYLPDLKESERRREILFKACALLVWHEEISEEFFLQVPNCKIIVRYGTGYDNIDLDEAKSRGIQVCYNPDYGVDEVADTTCAMILNAIRQVSLYSSNSQLSSTQWGVPSEIKISRTSSHRLGIIGAGRIGTSVARKMQVFGMKVAFFDPYLARGYEKSIGVERFETIAELQEFSTIVTFHCPLSEETKGMLNIDFIKNLNDETILINTSRGGLIEDLNHLDWGIKNAKISFLGLDVAPTEPIDLNRKPVKGWIEDRNLRQRVTITPHTAYYSQESYIELRTKAATNIKRFFDGLQPFNILI